MIQIRPTTISDAPGLARVQINSYRTAYTGIFPPSYLDQFSFAEQEQDWRDLLDSDTSDAVLVAVTGEDEIAGYVLTRQQSGEPGSELAPYDAEIVALHVRQENQSQGIGRRLLAAAALNLLEHGKRSAFLTVLQRNLRARRLYEWLGGQYLGEIKRFDVDGWEIVEVAYAWPKIFDLARCNFNNGSINLSILTQRQKPPEPWLEGDNIPWNEPGFSQRMLKEHLSQEHDAASRRFELIDRQVGWIFQQGLNNQPGQVLDLGCGPGLYASRLAALGCTCTGIDFSPAAIAFARQQAQEQAWHCTYIESDVRQANFGSNFDLVLFLYGEFNVFSISNARAILEKARLALRPGGRLLLEPHKLSTVRQIGQEPGSWQAVPSGLFSTQPHLLLEEGFWDSTAGVATRRYYLLEEDSNKVKRFAASYQSYTKQAYRRLLMACGFAHIQFFPSLTGEPDSQKGLFALMAECE